MGERREKWTSKTAFVLVSIGAAVGLGNIWRFPYIANENGGIWFLIPYVVCLLAVGIPLFLLEAGQGFLSKRGFMKSVEQSTDIPFFKKEWRNAVAMFPVLVSTVIMSYYAVLCGWTLWLVIEFLLNRTISFAAMQQSFTPVILFVAVLASAFWVVKKGIHKGLEPASHYLVPLLFISLILLFIYALTLPGALGLLWQGISGNSGKVLEAKTWYFALSQVFFSLGVGYGMMFTNGIYLKKGNGIFASSFQVAGADTLASVLAFFTITIFGGIIGAYSSGLAFSFEALPAFFAGQGAIGIAMGAAFFMLLFSAAFTSMLSFVEHTMVSIDFLGPLKKLAVWAGVFLLGLFSALSYTPLRLTLLGNPVLDQLDFTFGTFLAPFSAIVLIFACTYLLPHRHIAKAIGVPKNYEAVFGVLVKRVIPLAIALIILFSQISGLY
jgi:neurotransmitter:Na+ symporter, NSS family